MPWKGSGPTRRKSFDDTPVRALQFDSIGSLDALRVAELPAPVPGPGEALVEVRAAGINPSDVKNVLGRFPRTVLPGTPGREFSGIVREGPAEWIDRAVLGAGDGLGISRPGSHAELLVVPVEGLVGKPERLSFEQAGGLGVPWVTAWAAIVDAARLQPGESVLLTGAGGAVGWAASQIARWKGAAQVIGVVRGDSRHPGLAGLDHVFDSGRADLPAAVRQVTGGRGAEVVLDAVGGDLFEACLRSLAPRGRQVAIAASGARVDLNLADFYHNESTLLGMDSLARGFAECAAILNNLLPGFGDGALSPQPVEAVPLEEGPVAYRRWDQGSPRVRLVLVPGTT